MITYGSPYSLLRVSYTSLSSSSLSSYLLPCSSLENQRKSIAVTDGGQCGGTASSFARWKLQALLLSKYAHISDPSLIPDSFQLAQWAATRADLFPSLLCEHLGSLHSQGTPHSFQHTKHVIERVFQRPFDQVFEEFDETAIGTGAIAQVYRATLKKDLIPPSYLGPRRSRKRKTSAASLAPVILQHPPPSVPTASVAIKILHPQAAKTISRDLAIMTFFAHCISLLPGMQWISLPDEVNVFGNMMSQQLDLRNEAENLLTFEQNFSHRKVPATFPRPLQIWSTQDILVEEYENALPLEYFLRNGGGPYDDQVATFGLDAFLVSLKPI